MAPSLIPDCRNLTVSTWLLSLCFVHWLCLDFTVAEKEEWYTAFVNITYIDPVTSAPRTEKTECGRYGEHSPKREAKGQVLLPASPQDRQACDPNVRFPRAAQSAGAWVALVAAGNCSCQDKIRNVANSNSSAVVIYNTANDTITMPHPGRKHQPAGSGLHVPQSSSYRCQAGVLVVGHLVVFRGDQCVLKKDDQYTCVDHKRS